MGRKSVRELLKGELAMLAARADRAERELQGLREINMMLDAYVTYMLTLAAENSTERDETGARVVRIPPEEISRRIARYEVGAARDTETGEYVMFIREVDTGAETH